VITDHIALGGDSYSMIVTKDFSTGSDLGYDIFSDYVKRYSQIFIGIEDRISFSTITKPSNFGSINKSHTSFLIFLYFDSIYDCL
jgi:hypothetical protein